MGFILIYFQLKVKPSYLMRWHSLKSAIAGSFYHQMRDRRSSASSATGKQNAAVSTLHSVLSWPLSPRWSLLQEGGRSTSFSYLHIRHFHFLLMSKRGKEEGEEWKGAKNWKIILWEARRWSRSGVFVFQLFSETPNQIKRRRRREIKCTRKDT